MKAYYLPSTSTTRKGKGFIIGQDEGTLNEIIVFKEFGHHPYIHSQRATIF
jgi:hypothetical protein